MNKQAQNYSLTSTSQKYMSVYIEYRKDETEQNGNVTAVPQVTGLQMAYSFYTVQCFLIFLK